jgi:enolase
MVMAIVTASSNNLQIVSVGAREILDSRGIPTLECSLALNSGILVVTSISTANSGKNTDLVELRDKDEGRMHGLGVLRAANIINTQVAPVLLGRNPGNQEEIDRVLLELDPNKSLTNVGANTTMVVSQAVLKAAALSYGWPPYYYLFKKYEMSPILGIPTCIYGLIDGGKHGTDNLDFQEYQVIPASNIPFAKSLEIAVSMFKVLGGILKDKGAIRSVGPSGGYTPNLYKNTDAFDLIAETARVNNLTIGRDVFFGADFDAEGFYKGGKYKIKDQAEALSTKQWLTYLQDLNKLYGLFSFEDPFGINDLGSWKDFVGEFDKIARVICDSLTRTNAKLTEIAIKEKVGNTLIIKTGQVATFTDLIAAARAARAANWQIIISNREGETNDDLLADIGVGLGADFIKFGPPNRGERIAKYNRLLQINHELMGLAGQAQAAATGQAVAPAGV